MNLSSFGTFFPESVNLRFMLLRYIGKIVFFCDLFQLNRGFVKFDCWFVISQPQCYWILSQNASKNQRFILDPSA